jgi:hypothetical protein
MIMRKLTILAATLGVALVLAAVAFAQQVNQYTVTAAGVSPNAKGSKAKPTPVGVTFNYAIKEATGKKPSPVKTYKIAFTGLRTNGALFPTCTASKIGAAGNNDSGCPSKAKVGTGTIDSYVYQTADPSWAGGFPCPKKINLWNAGKNKMVIFIYGDPALCGGVGALPPIDAKFVNTSGGSQALQFAVPPTVLHPIAGLSVAVNSVTSKVRKLTVTKSGKRRGYFEAIGCSGGKRSVKVTFTPETGAAGTATKTQSC